ncbi:UDP-3-O-(3-hydroxymyristoyl)glucosamine N-acyltransferase [Pseudooceanicola sp. 216_PA32_1]|uniref:UDP-3-O-acylglucosamine N-acyltransferase n=1 Tax=Pseudooceanicola pacificus TaxID=2676438 RepID=A0A844WCL6_9RHOB|nr:UDP-3-O-(3-hydroxymyristoyl)glucosamine N-acyltransferase [Pseudooceanicola pacificus]MWB77300.1 UDP-3-O-(3-hydroxymyristoyl)glucosamine N-acyltransferase [Pseudooceanicola pacificus]
MPHSIAEIAAALGTEPLGDGSIEVSGVSEPATAGPSDLALAMKPDYAAGLAQGQAQAAMVWAGADWQSLGLKAAIVAPRARLAMAGLTRLLDPGQGYGAGIHPSAIIDPTAELGEGVSVGPFTIIAAGVKIGAGSVIGPQAHVGTDARIGPGAMLHTGVRIGARVRIGRNFIAQPGAAIGFDGLSFVTEEESGVERARATLGDSSGTRPQSWIRIHSLGSVLIGDDVEIGANSCVDSGTIRPTRIGDGSKIDNLCHIAHNVVVGRDCLFAALVGIAGSTTIGNNVVLGGQVGVTDNTTVGDNVVAGGASVILSKVPAGRVILGYPATKMETHLEGYKALRRLPRLFADVAALKKSVFKDGGND